MYRIYIYNVKSVLGRRDSEVDMTTFYPHEVYSFMQDTVEEAVKYIII